MNGATGLSGGASAAVVSAQGAGQPTPVTAKGRYTVVFYDVNMMRLLLPYMGHAGYLSLERVERSVRVLLRDDPLWKTLVAQPVPVRPPLGLTWRALVTPLGPIGNVRFPQGAKSVNTLVPSTLGTMAINYDNKVVAIYEVAKATAEPFIVKTPVGSSEVQLLFALKNGTFVITWKDGTFALHDPLQGSSGTVTIPAPAGAGEIHSIMEEENGILCVAHFSGPTFLYKLNQLKQPPVKLPAPAGVARLVCRTAIKNGHLAVGYQDSKCNYKVIKSFNLVNPTKPPTTLVELRGLDGYRSLDIHSYKSLKGSSTHVIVPFPDNSWAVFDATKPDAKPRTIPAPNNSFYLTSVSLLKGHYAVLPYEKSGGVAPAVTKVYDFTQPTKDPVTLLWPEGAIRLGNIRDDRDGLFTGLSQNAICVYDLAQLAKAPIQIKGPSTAGEVRGLFDLENGGRALAFVDDSVGIYVPGQSKSELTMLGRSHRGTSHAYMRAVVADLGNNSVAVAYPNIGLYVYDLAYPNHPLVLRLPKGVGVVNSLTALSNGYLMVRTDKNELFLYKIMPGVGSSTATAVASVAANQTAASGTVDVKSPN